jgi:hypothetical protein
MGTKMQQVAWELVSPHVTEYATLASALPEQHYDYIEPRFRGSLTLADAIVITRMQGIIQAADMAPLDRAPLDREIEAGDSFQLAHFIEPNKTDFSMSPLLVT